MFTKVFAGRSSIGSCHTPKRTRRLSSSPCSPPWAIWPVERGIALGGSDMCFLPGGWWMGLERGRVCHGRLGRPECLADQAGAVELPVNVADGIAVTSQEANLFRSMFFSVGVIRPWLRSAGSCPLLVFSLRAAHHTCGTRLESIRSALSRTSIRRFVAQRR
jgi:hypothetical protein